MIDVNGDLPLVIVISGPTGVGKTSASIGIAQRTSGEIVNADSRSFYRGMDIGTAKPTIVERSKIPHHLIDILDPADEMSLAHFQSLATASIDDVLARGGRPLLVGGTAQYLNAMIENWAIPAVAPDQQWRRTMEARLRSEGSDWLIAELLRVDPVSLERTGPNPRRIIRALEVHRATGRPMSEQIGKRASRYRFATFELWAPRDVLHARIAERIDRQLAEGLVDEVRRLLAAGVDPSWPSFQSIGYREVVPHLQGFQNLGQVRDAMVHASNRLVRHQQTWFRKMPDMYRVDVTGEEVIDSIVTRLRLS